MIKNISFYAIILSLLTCANIAHASVPTQGLSCHPLTAQNTPIILNHDTPTIQVARRTSYGTRGRTTKSNGSKWRPRKM